jgi:hypothetical protein
MFLIYQVFDTQINPDIFNQFKGYDIIIFSNKRQNLLLNTKIKVLKRRTPLKWTDVFNFVLNNPEMNKKGSLVYEIDKPLPKFSPNDGVQVFNHGVYLKNIKSKLSLNRKIFTNYNLLSYKIDKTLKVKVIVECDKYFKNIIQNKKPNFLEFYYTPPDNEKIDYKLTLKKDIYFSGNSFFKDVWIEKLHKLIEFDKLQDKIINKENIILSDFKQGDIFLDHGYQNPNN